MTTAPGSAPQNVVTLLPFLSNLKYAVIGQGVRNNLHKAASCDLLVGVLAQVVLLSESIMSDVG